MKNQRTWCLGLSRWLLFWRLPPPWWIFFYWAALLHLSHVKQICSQPINLTHELILWIQITSRRVDINGDSTVKSPCWCRVSNLQPSDPDLIQLWLQNLIMFIQMEILYSRKATRLRRCWCWRTTGSWRRSLSPRSGTCSSGSSTMLTPCPWPGAAALRSQLESREWQLPASLLRNSG